MNRLKNRVRFVSLLALLFVALLLACSSAIKIGPPGAIEIPKEKIIYDDGDTITFDDVTIRILGIDTPEISHPEHGYSEDQAYGREASARAEELMRAAKKVSYMPYQEDQYGRMLGHVFIDGKLLGITLLEEGLAYETISHYGDNGFPALAAELQEAAQRGPEPKFEPPYIWRREHRQQPEETDQPPPEETSAESE